ncbi:uncharacterized protein LOC118186899 isoform X2 [Stegodyphus dumicola]|uniref:uncharacterized protein LOC118186899 isoform X2 n=1 Tax=Stegodyphus dumicola TaxID=202533 RepID=UPI0015A84E59|nr:uncharacterized protein LOC118186899 isoform X2 [Stegodyphus dumicola]
MIHECSDRVSVIVNNQENSAIQTKVQASFSGSSSLTETSMIENTSGKFSAFEKLQDENMKLLKNYRRRLEMTNDKCTKTNLKLEFERRLAENAILAKKKYDIAVKQLQKERVQMMENAIRKLFENDEYLSEKDKEKKELYTCVVQYAKNETWPCSWKLNSYETSVSEAAQKLFQKTIRCYDHPLSQWLMLVQTNIKREVDALLKQYSEYLILLPNQCPNEECGLGSYEEHPKEIVLKNSFNETKRIPSSKIVCLQKALEALSLEISNTIGNALEIFYLIYKSFLPDDSESACYNLIETYLLVPIWPNLINLFRISNISSEYKVSVTMFIHRSSDPSKFGFLSKFFIAPDMYHDVILLLQSLPKYCSLVEKLKILVQISQSICKIDSVKGSSEKIGADELIPLLCYVIVQSRLPQLFSECHAIEQLYDMKYMFGEEGYALSSFLTALKYIEIKKALEVTVETCRNY